MDRCFVIQPFDDGAFDKRFDDVLTPAIASVNLEAYRVDRDPTVTVPIEAIESGIKEAAACLADITTDNPNVWFELGYAIARGKPVVLICSSARETRFPFDIQHRHIIRYKTDSSSDFGKLSEEIAGRLSAAMAKESRVQALSQTTLQETGGLEPHEIAALVIIAESDLDPESYPSAYAMKQDMGKAGYTELAAVLAVNSLRSKGLVTSERVEPYNGDIYMGFCLLDDGRNWLMSNLNRLSLKKSKPLATDDFNDFPKSLDDDGLPF